MTHTTVQRRWTTALATTLGLAMFGPHGAPAARAQAPKKGAHPAAAGAGTTANPAANAAGSATLTLDPTGTQKERIGYFPIRVPLSETRPAGITHEPAYRSKARYAVIHVGNGPKSAYVIAVDEPNQGDFKIYVDKNRNGDLTDDGDGAWSAKKEGNGRVMYGLNQYTVRASWGTPQKETSSGEYGVAFYRFVGMDFLLMFREGARTGTLSLGGKTHKAMLVENDADAVYAKPLDDNGKPVNGGAETHPVWLMVDMNDDGKFASGEAIDIRSPFKLDGKAYEAKVSTDGARLQLFMTKRKVAEKPHEPESPPLLKAGATAPDFAAEAWGGGTTRLSDLRGKVVVLDFWATWCGPCQKSMPHIEKVYQAVKGKDVAVVGLCVFDEKAAYEKWVPENKEKYTFTFAFDPAGRDPAKSIAGKLYNVSGIPTTYIIDKDGKVAEAIVGYDDGDTRVEAALKKLGIEIAESK